MSRISALYLTLAGATCMSFVGLLIRLIKEADGFQILFYRSLGMSAIILLIVSVRRKEYPLLVLKSLDKSDFFMGVFFSLAFLTYVFSILAGAPVSSAELRNRGLMKSYSGIWSVWWMSR